MSVESPCIRHCTLDDADICLGCGRTLDEICAIVTMGWQVPRANAAGLLGPSAFKSTGIGIWIVGFANRIARQPLIHA